MVGHVEIIMYLFTNRVHCVYGFSLLRSLVSSLFLLQSICLRLQSDEWQVWDLQSSKSEGYSGIIKLSNIHIYPACLKSKLNRRAREREKYELLDFMKGQMSPRTHALSEISRAEKDRSIAVEIFSNCFLIKCLSSCNRDNNLSSVAPLCYVRLHPLAKFVMWQTLLHPYTY